MNIEYGVCPVCNGTKEVPLTENEKRYSWNEGKTYRNCGNCGAQKMYGVSTGKVRLNKNGEPCVHKYSSRNAGRCLTDYTCSECGDSYQIDSGD